LSFHAGGENGAVPTMQGSQMRSSSEGPSQSPRERLANEHREIQELMTSFEVTNKKASRENA